MSFHCVHTSRKGTLGSPETEMRFPSGQRPATNRNSANVKDKTVTRQFWFAIYADLLSWLWIAAQTEAPRCILNAPSALIWQIWVHLSLELAVWFLPRRYMVYFSPLPRLFGKGSTTRSLDPARSWRAFLVSNQPRNCGTLGDTSSGNEFISS